MTMTGVVLAGGRATRLGPVAAQLSKALVSLGQRPALVHHVLALKEAGCERVVVVVSPRGWEQVAEVLARAGLAKETDLVVQARPHGPADAIRVGLEGVRGPALVLMADTFLEAAELRRLAEVGPGDVVAVAPMPVGGRSWCWLEEGVWRDSVPEGRGVEAPRVAVGAYRVLETARWRRAAATLAASTPVGVEVGMATLLNAVAAEMKMELGTEGVATWLDLGDLDALAEARRRRFIARDGHRLELDERGVLTKSGAGDDELRAWANVALAQASGAPVGDLFPRVVDVTGETVRTEFVDLPTLAELWLYWPGRPELWGSLVRRVCESLSAWLWRREEHVTTAAVWEVAMRARRMYLEQPVERLTAWPEGRADGLARRAIEMVRTLMEPEFEGGKGIVERVSPGVVHGDPNFANVLVSLNAGVVKLVDPRGSWGGAGPLGDVTYDLAKLGYSARGWAAVVHGLEVETLERDRETAAIARVLGEFGDAEWRRTVEAVITLAGAPLHRGDEGRRLAELGLKLAEEV